jgi:hypothetical protein
VLPLAAWGAGLIAIDLLGILAFGLGALPAGLLAGAGAGSVATAVLAVAAASARAPDPRADVLTLGSAATPIACAGIAVAVFGAAAGGEAFTWPGVGVAVAGLVGVALERRAERRLERKAGR